MTFHFSMLTPITPFSVQSFGVKFGIENCNQLCFARQWFGRLLPPQVYFYAFFFVSFSGCASFSFLSFADFAGGCGKSFGSEINVASAPYHQAIVPNITEDIITNLVLGRVCNKHQLIPAMTQYPPATSFFT